MSTAQTLREPRAERLRGKSAPQNTVEAEETETAQQWYRCWCRECDERYEQRKRAGLIAEPELTMEEIVAIVKEVRAERYAEEQEQKKRLVVDANVRISSLLTPRFRARLDVVFSPVYHLIVCEELFDDLARAMRKPYLAQNIEQADYEILNDLQ